MRASLHQIPEDALLPEYSLERSQPEDRIPPSKDSPVNLPSERKQKCSISEVNGGSEVATPLFGGSASESATAKKPAKYVARNQNCPGGKLSEKGHRVLKVNKKSKTSQIRTSKKQRALLLEARVAIIGAGMAGISAARRLHDAGVQVTLYEARNRVGGRICTASYKDIDGIDMGACWIHGTDDNSVFKACDRYHLFLYLQDTDQSKMDVLYDINGEEFDARMDKWGLQTHRRHQSEADNLAKQKSTRIAVEISLGSQMESKLEEAAENDPKKRRLLNWHMANIECNSGGESSELGLCTWDQDDLTALSEDPVMVFEGYQRVVENLASGLNICFNSVVSKIEYNSQGVSLTLCGMESPIFFDYCIITVPLGVLKASLSFVAEETNSKMAVGELHGQPVDLTNLKYDTLLIEEKDVDSYTASSSSFSSVHSPEPSPPLPLSTFSITSTSFSDGKSFVPIFAINSKSKPSPLKVENSVDTAECTEGCIKFQPSLPEWKV
ncbi:putative flavin-containing monoamine oxidase AofH, partial [Cardiosporidium cionae]